MKGFIRIVLCAVALLVGTGAQAQSFGTLFFGSSKPKNNYMGQMADNRKDKNGTGMQLEKDGTVYVGDFSQGKYSGFGMLIAGSRGFLKNLPETRFYVGEFIDGKKEGRGTCYGSDGEPIYSGMFSEDTPVGGYPSVKVTADSYFSTMELPDGEFYVGEMENGLPDGYGIFMTPDNSFAIGRVRDGKRFGLGLLLLPPSDWMSVKWTDHNSYTTVTTSEKYRQRLEEYRIGHEKNMAEFRQSMTEVMTGLASVASQYAETQASSSGSADYSSGSSGTSGSSRSKSGSRKSEKSKGADCGSAWMSASRAYSDYESQLVPNGARTATSDSDRRNIKSKMRSIRTKWEKRGCPINKSPYED